MRNPRIISLKRIKKQIIDAKNEILFFPIFFQIVLIFRCMTFIFFISQYQNRGYCVISVFSIKSHLRHDRLQIFSHAHVCTKRFFKLSELIQTLPVCRFSK